MTNIKKVLALIEKGCLATKSKDKFFLFISQNLKITLQETKKIIEKLINSGKICEVKPCEYVVIPNEKLGLYYGKFMGTMRGFGFCSCEGLNCDVFIPANRTNFALDGDKVICKVYSTTAESAEGLVYKIVDKVSTIVGIVDYVGENTFLVPKGAKISTTFAISSGEKYEKGTILLCKLDRREDGKIIALPQEIIGAESDIKALELSLIREHGIFETFPEDVVKESENISQSLSQKDIQGRLDLRNEIIFTIDGEDAKDLDDAVSIEKTKDGYKLGVHIADVGNYVQMGSKLDEEAYKRGTSTYFPTSVLPMLPKLLSNGICSLNEGQDRLTLSCIMDIDNNGKVKNYSIVESVINSKARLTYTQVHNALYGKTDQKTQNLINKFKIMLELSQILEKNAKNRGTLELDIKETEFVFDKDGLVVDLKKRERNEAHKIIEDFMVLANETVARYAKEQQLPFMYRVHEPPKREKVIAVCEFLKGIGVDYPKIPEKITPEYYQKLLKIVENKPFVETVNKILLRSMQKARYTNEDLGHFGLALIDYCHFTSPIRRYPDLCIHRILKENLKKKIAKTRKENLDDFVQEASLQSSEREKNAEQAERDVDDLWKAYLMKDRIGEQFEGTISSVTNFGIYVELDNSVEGLIKIETLPGDNYLFLEKKQSLRCSIMSFSIGERVKVKLTSSNLYTRHIDFEFIKKA